MPRRRATHRASSTSATEQQPESDSPPHSLSVAPTTSWPASQRRAAATDESTPPDIATRTAPRHAGAPSREWAWRLGDRRRHRVTGGVDVGLDGGPAERQPQRAGRLRPVDADRRQHVRRLLRTAGTARCRAGQHTMVVLEEEEQRLAVDRGEADVGDAGHEVITRRSRWHRALARCSTAAPIAVTSSSRQARARSTSACRWLAAARAAAANATALATSCVPLRRSRSCPPPICCARIVTPVRTTSAPTPTGPPHLCEASVMRSAAAAAWATSSQVIAWAASVWISSLRCSLSDDGGNVVEPLHGADLVVHEPDRDQGHGVVELCREGVEVDQPAVVHRDDPASTAADWLEHGLVLDGGAHDRAAAGGEHAPDRQVVGLGAAAREDDLAGRRTDEGGELGPRVVERGATRPRQRVCARGVAEAGVQGGVQRRPRLGPQRGARRVVEVVPGLGHQTRSSSSPPWPPGGRAPAGSGGGGDTGAGAGGGAAAAAIRGWRRGTRWLGWRRGTRWRRWWRGRQRSPGRRRSHRGRRGRRGRGPWWRRRRWERWRPAVAGGGAAASDAAGTQRPQRRGTARDAPPAARGGASPRRSERPSGRPSPRELRG